MDSESSFSWKAKAQIVVAIMIIIASVRVYMIYRERNAPAPAKTEPVGYTNKDYYVMPSKLHAYDLKSLRAGTVGKTIWVHAGNQVIYYPYNASTHRVDFKHDTQLLPPLAALHVEDIITANGPSSLQWLHNTPSQPEFLILFKMDGADGEYAASAGTPKDGENSIYFDDIFFTEDPHQLYKHWSPDVWDAVDHHQVKPGMNELQTSFALGTNVSTVSGGGDIGNRTLEFANAGKPIQVTFRDDKATQIAPIAK